MHDFDLEKTLSSDSINISNEMLEIGLDSVLKDGLFQDIPVFNILTGIAKLGLNIKDRIFIKKLVCFLYETQNTSIKDRQKIIKKINDSQKYRSTIGEKLILIIDKSDELYKAHLIGKLFLNVLTQKIDYKMFLRCSNSINNSYISDLEWFLESTHFEITSSLESDGLLNSGILRFSTAEGAVYLGDASLDLKYDISKVGQCIHKYLGEKEYKMKLID